MKSTHLKSRSRLAFIADDMTRLDDNEHTLMVTDIRKDEINGTKVKVFKVYEILKTGTQCGKMDWILRGEFTAPPRTSDEDLFLFIPSYGAR